MLAHEPADPFGLPHVGGKELEHHGLDVQNRCAVDRIESAYVWGSDSVLVKGFGVR